MSLLLSRFLSTVTASSTLCFSFSNQGLIDDDLPDTNFMTSSTTAAFVINSDNTDVKEFIANNNKRHSQAAMSFSASILVGFIRTSTSPSSLFLLPYASAFRFPIYRSAIFFAHLKTSFCL
jgi:hypothetical protein